MKRAAFHAWMTMMLVAPAAFAAHGAHADVIICLDAPLQANVASAPISTNAIFARIGIRLEWRDGRRCPEGALRIGFSTSTPSNLKPAALAYALPYEGTHIVVFLDRIHDAIPEGQVPVALGHVFAHEITHILQGCARHSDAGLMKARWTAEDYVKMKVGLLQLTPYDVQLIHNGLAHRTAAARLSDSRTQLESPSALQ